MKIIKKNLLFLILNVTIFFHLHAKNQSNEDAVYKSLADTLSKVEKKLVNKTVAVYGFEVIGKPGDTYAVFATEKLTHQLVSNGSLKVIERSRINQVLKEQSLTMSGIIDTGTAARIGKILAVDAVIVGTIHLADKDTEFFVRVIQSETGVILASVDKKMTELGADLAVGDTDKEAKEPEIKKEDELARVSILPFEDRTNSKNFQYMADSLSDAINTSMSKDFLYSRIDTKEVKKTIFDMQQEIIKEKIQNKDKPVAKKTTKTIKDKKKESGDAKKEEEEAKIDTRTPEEIQRDEDQLILVKKIAENLNSDIVIYGNYKYDNETNEIVFTVNLYLALSDALKTLEQSRNVVDNTLFRATENVSKSLVFEIHYMIDEAEKAKMSKEEAAKQAEEGSKKTGEKVALTRKVAMAPTPTWASKKVSISLQPGFFINDVQCGFCEIPVYLSGRFWLIPNLYLGATLGASGIEPGMVPFFSKDPSWVSVVAIGHIGFALPAQAWLFSADIGAGYYFINNTTTGWIYNPVYATRFGVEVLLSEFFSVGIMASLHMYYDDPKPVYLGGLMLAFNFVM